MTITLKEFAVFVVRFVEDSLDINDSREEFQMEINLKKLPTFAQVWNQFKQIVKQINASDNFNNLQRFVDNYNQQLKLAKNQRQISVAHSANGKGLYSREQFQSGKNIQIDSNRKNNQSQDNINNGHNHNPQKQDSFQSCKSINEKLPANQNNSNNSYQKSRKIIEQSGNSINLTNQQSSKSVIQIRQKQKQKSSQKVIKVQERQSLRNITIDRKVSYQQLQRKSSQQQNQRANLGQQKQQKHTKDHIQQSKDGNQKNSSQSGNSGSFQKILLSFKKLCSTFESNHNKLLREDFTNKYININANVNINT